MTAPARITQDDMERVFKSLKNAGHEHARVVMDLKNQTIAVTLGEEGEGESPRTAVNPWDSLLANDTPPAH